MFPEHFLSCTRRFKERSGSVRIGRRGDGMRVVPRESRWRDELSWLSSLYNETLAAD
jgi:hypothetical protein